MIQRNLKDKKKFLHREKKLRFSISLKQKFRKIAKIRHEIEWKCLKIAVEMNN